MPRPGEGGSVMRTYWLVTEPLALLILVTLLHLSSP
jgi:hypothetical protein